MPNHVYQKLSITAKPELIAHIKQSVSFKKDGGETIAFSEKAFFQMPEELQCTRSGSDAIASQEDYDKYMSDTERVQQDLRMGIGLPVTHEMASILCEKYGCANWYDWAIKNWGTKWGVYNVGNWEDFGYGCYSSIRFESAWSPATLIIQKLSEIYPGLRCKLEFIDEGWNFAGWQIICNGSVVKDLRVECSPKNDCFAYLASSIGYEISQEDEE